MTLSGVKFNRGHTRRRPHRHRTWPTACTREMCVRVCMRTCVCVCVVCVACDGGGGDAKRG